MELQGYEGGRGGKMRRPALRRPSPYDRPAAAVRGLAPASRSGSGWLSKLVDPASRFITGSASRIFSSMFRKGLTGLPAAEGSEQNCQVRPCLPETVDVAPSESQVQEAVGVHNPTENFETPGISEIEQLLKQNKYTRAQVDYLTKLICSRSIEPTGQESENYNGKVHVSGKGIVVGNSGLNRNLSTSETTLNIPQDVAASPAEIAKAYMSSKLPKASSSAISLHSQGFREDKSSPFSGPSATKPHGLSVIPQSVLRFSEPHELSGAGYPTPKPRGRSAIYRMSRSPYFKVSKYTTVSNDPASSQGTPGSTSKSDARQVLKRGSSVLDGEYGSFGPIRRIRQKSGLVSASNARFVSSSSSRSFPLLQLDKEDLKDPTSSQKPHALNELKYASSDLQIAENGDSKIFSSNVPPVPGKSIETSLKILEQLDKFAPSREKKSNTKPIAMDESPSKLTADMLNGRALRSMENVDTSQFISMDVIGTSDFRNAKDPQKIRAFQSEKLGKAQENSPSKLDVPGVKFVMAARPSSAEITNTIPATVLLQRKPAFQMIAPEDLLELDDEQDAVDASVQPSVNVVKTKSRIEETEASISSMSAPEQPLLSSSKRMSVSSSLSFTEINKAYDASHDSEKESSFRFPVATKSTGLSSPFLTPTMPSQSHDKQLSRSEQTVVPAFMFASRNSGTTIPSSVTDVADESRIESKPDQSPVRKIQLEGSNLFSGGKHEAGLHKSPGIVALSGISASGSAEANAFGASITSTQSNGSVHSSSLSSSLAASTPDAIPRSPVSLFSSNSKLIAASSSSPPISSTLPAFSAAVTFNFGTSSTPSPDSVSLLSDKSNSVDAQGKVSNKSPSGSFNPPTAQVPSSFLSTGNSNTSLMGSSPSPGSGGIPSVEEMPSSTSMPTNPTSVMPYIFSGVSSSGSSFAASPSFTTKTNGVFGSSVSAQINDTSASAANNSSQKSTTNFGATGGSVFGVQPVQSGSSNSLFSQSSTSQPGSFSSSATLGLNSSSSAFGTSSASAFGSNSSSSPGFGLVPFGTTNQSAKPFGSTSGFSFTSAASTSSSSGFSFSSGTGVSSTSSAFFSSPASVSNSSSGLSFSTGSSTLNPGFSFSASASSSSPAGNTFSPAVTSLGSSSSISGSVFGSSPSAVFSFGLKSTASDVSPFGFGSSSGPAFSFASSGATMSTATATPVFEMRSASGGFSSASQNNDQMSVEDTMADDTNQAPVSTVTFGQPNSTPYQNFVFGSAVPSSGTPLFQFGSQQNPPTLQNPNPFQAGGNSEFAPGGSFSLGSGGGDKSSRKIVKVRRDKIRRK